MTTKKNSDWHIFRPNSQKSLRNRVCQGDVRRRPHIVFRQPVIRVAPMRRARTRTILPIVVHPCAGNKNITSPVVLVVKRIFTGALSWTWGGGAAPVCCSHDLLFVPSKISDHSYFKCIPPGSSSLFALGRIISSYHLLVYNFHTAAVGSFVITTVILSQPLPIPPVSGARHRSQSSSHTFFGGVPLASLSRQKSIAS